MTHVSTLLALVAVLLAAPLAGAQPPPQQQRLVPNVTAPGDGTGSGVNINGEVAIVGVPFHDARGTDQGSAFIFRMAGGVWQLEDRLDPEGDQPDAPVGTPVAVGSGFAFIGARSDDNDAGTVLIFRDNGDGTWPEVQRLRPADVQAQDRFGSHIRIDGDRVVIGADQNARNGAGSAYVYRLAGNTWELEAKLAAADGAQGDRFGFTTDIDGTRVVLGASGDDGGRGAAYVFQRAGGGTSWNQVAKLTASDRAAGDLPLSVAISGTTVLMGTQYQDSRGEDAGAVYVFEGASGAWAQTAKLTPANAAAGDRFGGSLALNDDQRAVIGAPGADNGAGSAYVFARVNGAWEEGIEFKSDGQQAGDQFGGSTGVSGFYGVVGANNEGSGAGAAYVFDLRAAFAIAVETPPSVGGVEVEAPTPNPSAGEATVRYYVPRAGHAEVSLLDVLGREVRRVAEGPVGEGWHDAAVSAAGLPAGTYVLRVATATGRASVPWTVAR